MIDVETVMSRSFQTMAAYETLRAKFLRQVVSTDMKAVQTRETVLRVLGSNLAPIYQRILPQKEALQANICEKRNSKVIDDALLAERPFFMNAARAFFDYGLPASQVDLLVSALESNSPVLRVAGMAAVILLAAYMEMDSLDGN
jgi:hypothetical protein